MSQKKKPYYLIIQDLQDIITIKKAKKEKEKKGTFNLKLDE